MKTLPAGMQADLDSGATTHCMCWKLTRNDGIVLGFTDHDNDLQFGDPLVTFEATSGFTASAIDQSMGLAVDNMEITSALISDRLTEGDLSAGLWDNAEIQIYRVDWSDTTKRVLLMRGSIGEISRGNLAFVGEIRSLAQTLNQEDGRIYTLQCDADLFDSRCKVVDTGFTNTGSVDSTDGIRTITCNDAGIIARTATFFDRGLLTWTSGDNNTYSMEVKSHTITAGIATITLWEAMPFSIQVGDAFTVKAGCDKTCATCKAKFDNVINFRGFPRIPGADAVQYYARKDGDNTGGSIWE